MRIGDGVRFLGPDDQPRDWLVVSDAFTERYGLPGESRNQLFLNISTPLDVIQGVGLDQEFDIATPIEERDASGFYNTVIGNVRTFFSFAVERLRVSRRLAVCRR